jgi:tRNA A37 methylthiotransferase MiaB
MPCDHLLLIPFEPTSGWMLDPGMRTSIGARFTLAGIQALSRFESFVGRPLRLNDAAGPPLFGGKPFVAPKNRSLAAVSLSTHLEAAGLDWVTLDPGAVEISWWRAELTRLAHLNPLTIGISTTFILSELWISLLVRLVRRTFPRAKLIIGGYYYGTDAKGFLALDGDIHCVGEAELRLPQLVQRLKDGKPIDDIPGLYFRRDGRMISTGKAHAPDLQHLRPPDWKLSERIEPRIDISRELVRLPVETQRGCVFKCTFCTHRTLSLHEATSIEKAVDRILGTSIVKNAEVELIDPTASFPRERWQAILNRIIERGGAPHPIWAFARVTDINDDVAALMARAGVRVVFIGQESGDQRILDRMKKGTKIAHVAPAMQALAKHGILVELGMIHGFPDETRETALSTRNLLKTINDGLPWPSAFHYALSPFTLNDFATIAQDTTLQADERHPMHYRTKAMTQDEIVDECVRTIVEVSEVPHAPVCELVLWKTGGAITASQVSVHPGRFEIHRWLKWIERGMGMFLAADFGGPAPDERALEQLRANILGQYERPRAAWQRATDQVVATARAFAVRRVQREWTSESQGKSPGPVTRTLCAVRTFADLRDPKDTVAALRRGRPPQDEAAAQRATPEVGGLASKFVQESVDTAGRVKLRVSTD